MGNGSSGQHPYGNLEQSSGCATCLGCVVILEVVMKELVMVVVVVEIVVVASNSHKYFRYSSKICINISFSIGKFRAFLFFEM